MHTANPLTCATRTASCDGDVRYSFVSTPRMIELLLWPSCLAAILELMAVNDHGTTTPTKATLERPPEIREEGGS